MYVYKNWYVFAFHILLFTYLVSLLPHHHHHHILLLILFWREFYKTCRNLKKKSVSLLFFFFSFLDFAVKFSNFICYKSETNFFFFLLWIFFLFYCTLYFVYHNIFKIKIVPKSIVSFLKVKVWEKTSNNKKKPQENLWFFKTNIAKTINIIFESIIEIFQQTPTM